MTPPLLQQTKLNNALVPLHFITLIIVALLANTAGLVHLHIETIPELHWDPSWYHAIATKGYYYSSNEQSSVAFFPLFPLVWRGLHLGAYGISIFNWGLLICSLIMLVHEYKMNYGETLMVASSMGLFYCWLPFSESVFLFTSTLVLIGYKKDNIGLTAAGLFLASMSRSAAVVFIPAVLLVEIMGALTRRQGIKAHLIKAAVYFAVCCAAVLLVVFIQWQDTGEWFVFSKAHKFWNKKLQFPAIPINTWGNNFKLLFLDASALITGLIAGVTVVYLIAQGVLKKHLSNQPDLHFALAYLGGVTLISLFFGVQGEDTTFINSLNRYIFCTAFFLVFILYYSREKKIDWLYLGLVIAIAVLGVALTGYYANPYGDNQLLSVRLDAIGIILGVFIYLVPLTGKLNTARFVVLYIFQTGLQLHFFEMYLTKQWVG